MSSSAPMPENVKAREAGEKTGGSDASGGRHLVILLCSLLAVAGWLYLAAVLASMVPVMDMSEAGPGMGLFNAFNIFDGLPKDVRAALAVLCLPAGATTFGMPSEHWGAGGAALVFLMWMMMTLAMMLPSAMPVFLAHAKRRAHAVSGPSATATVSLLALGYLTIWTAYALAATLVQWLLTGYGLLSSMMAPVSLVFSATTLIAAGLYQFTPAKQACLLRCWYPRWSSPATGGSAVSFYREGLVQGLACLGCCWALMTVMFAVGIMNIIWVGLLGAVMALEKNLPSRWFYKATGVFLLLWGLSLMGATLVLSGKI
ncbi:Predicted metal-binding integral membrane protein [Pannonibacter phragmitetus]|uniref:Predicted metal-binding integral membrane protein n=1 Tax=Pannonibacter phragmitetus TaxID=121719 RepID=A0A378ZW42_9HYPH|nr:DUF2182 domain-containing protein [Pannonibacter phragmitetus]SUB01213.1 Predicted metal-binding integral membrane protein [Pannonibacter phragmitetus]